jgi:hypothetical protein
MLWGGVLSLRAAEELRNKGLRREHNLNEIAYKNLFCSFRHHFDRDSSSFQHLFVPFNIFSLFFVFSLKCSLRAADHFTNRIQREFLFNDAIQSQNQISRLSRLTKFQTFSNEINLAFSFLVASIYRLSALLAIFLPIHSAIISKKRALMLPNSSPTLAKNSPHGP